MPSGSSSSAFGVRSTATTVNPAPASSVAVALPSSPAPPPTATLSPAPPNEGMTTFQPSTYNRKAGYLPQRPQDRRRTGKRPSLDSGDSRTRRPALSFSQPDVVGTELGHRQGLPGPAFLDQIAKPADPLRPNARHSLTPCTPWRSSRQWCGRRAAAARRYPSAEGT